MVYKKVLIAFAVLACALPREQVEGTTVLKRFTSGPQYMDDQLRKVFSVSGSRKLTVEDLMKNLQGGLEIELKNLKSDNSNSNNNLDSRVDLNLKSFDFKSVMKILQANKDNVQAMYKELLALDGTNENVNSGSNGLFDGLFKDLTSYGNWCGPSHGGFQDCCNDGQRCPNCDPNSHMSLNGKCMDDCKPTDVSFKISDVCLFCFVLFCAICLFLFVK